MGNMTSISKSIAIFPIATYSVARKWEHESSFIVDIEGVLNQILQNRFDPAIDSKDMLPDKPGIYFICLKHEIALPKLFDGVVFTELNESRIMYIGIAGKENTNRKSLWDRGFENHFEGNNSGKSSVRKSLGVIFGYKQIPRDREPCNGKTKFGENDEANLSQWMKQSLFLHFAKHSSPWTVESRLIKRFNPPLNLLGNRNPVNALFRKTVSRLRKSKT
jgi:hypothetical protein